MIEEDDKLRPRGVGLSQQLRTILLMRPDREQFEEQLAQAADQIATTHGIKDVSAQLELLMGLHAEKAFRLSEYEFESDAWTIPRDLTPWKKAHSKLRGLAKKLALLRKSLKEVIDDAVMYGALSHVDTKGRLDQLILAVSEFERLAKAASTIKGETGNRPHPGWAIEAAHICRDFWRKHMHDEPKRYFSTVKESKSGKHDKNKTTEPLNNFSKWFCDVMRQVGGFVPSQCDTLLRAESKASKSAPED